MKFEDIFVFRFKETDFDQIKSLFAQLQSSNPGKIDIDSKKNSENIYEIDRIRNEYDSMSTVNFRLSGEGVNIGLMVHRDSKWITLSIRVNDNSLFQSTYSLFTSELKLKPSGYEKLNLKGIRDLKLKKILNENYTIALLNYDREVWKVTIIMCGGIIEASLIHLLNRVPQATIDSSFKKVYPTHKHKNLKDYTFEELIAVGKENGYLGKDEGFADAIRNYRNLIHPQLELSTTIRASERLAKISLEYTKIFFDRISNIK